MNTQIPPASLWRARRSAAYQPQSAPCSSVEFEIMAAQPEIPAHPAAIVPTATPIEIPALNPDVTDPESVGSSVGLSEA